MDLYIWFQRMKTFHRLVFFCLVSSPVPEENIYRDFQLVSFSTNTLLSSFPPPLIESLGDSTRRGGNGGVPAAVCEGDELLQPDRVGKSFAAEPLESSASRAADMAEELHWRSSSLPSLWRSLGSLHLLLEEESLPSQRHSLSSSLDSLIWFFLLSSIRFFCLDLDFIRSEAFDRACCDWHADVLIWMAWILNLVVDWVFWVIRLASGRPFYRNGWKVIFPSFVFEMLHLRCIVAYELDGMDWSDIVIFILERWCTDAGVCL